jgi:hypothetical protein
MQAMGWVMGRLEQAPDVASEGAFNLWVLKPLSGSRGIHVSLSSDLEEIRAFKGHRIVQKYVEEPWVLSRPVQGCGHAVGRKFDLRFWVLLTSVNPLRAWVFSQAYGRVCPKEYSAKDPDLRCHLTNYSLNQKEYSPASSSVLTDPELTLLLEEAASCSFEYEIKP